MKKINAVIMALMVGGFSSSGAFATIYDLDADTVERAGGDGSDLKEIHYGIFQLSAYNFAGGSPYTDATKIWAYLDHTGVKDGGGACQTNNCAGSSDDNLSRVSNNEMLSLTLSGGSNSFASLTLWGDHQDYAPTTVWADLDGFGTAYDFLAYAVSTDALTGEATFNIPSGINTKQVFITAIDSAESSQLYLSSVTNNSTTPDLGRDVPVPSTLWLFAALGLMGVGRRKTA